MTELNNNSIDKMFIIGGGFCIIGALITMGAWFVLYGGGSGTKTSTTIYKTLPAEEFNIIKKTIDQLENMPLLELIDLRNKITKFKEGNRSLEIDVSGIMEVFNWD